MERVAAGEIDRAGLVTLLTGEMPDHDPVAFEP
jgi:hypothetical protein